MFQAQPHYGFASHTPTMTVDGVDLNMDGVSDIPGVRRIGALRSSSA